MLRVHQGYSRDLFNTPVCEITWSFKNVSWSFYISFLHKYKVITGTINVLVFYSSGDIAQVVEQ